MQGLMMQTPLNISSILTHARRNFADQEIVSRAVEGGFHRYTYRDFYARTCQLAHALTEMGIETGDRVGVIGWNTWRQLELYYAISCIGAVCHTINPRLGPENAAFVINHAEDKVIFYDTTFAPLAEGLAAFLPCVEKYVVMTDADHKGEGKFTPDIYEDLLAGQPEEFDWPLLDENLASGMCYTSGTTGQPKGVVYSHRSTVIHTLLAALPTTMGAEAEDILMPVVPMFHVNAWGVPYAALMMGTKLVLPGPGMDGASLHEIIEQEQVTYALGVPTIWLNLLNYVNSEGKTFSSLKFSLIGGAALPESLILGYEEHGVKSRQGWGMTEMSPIGTINFQPPSFYDRPREERIPEQLKQGKAVPLVDMRLVNDDGHVIPHDGKTSGHLQVRGPAVLSGYYKLEGETLTLDGWFDTGDVAIIDADGVMSITDRSKDVIKSGGEWISTLDIENIAMTHPHVSQAAVIGIPHPKWDERPLLIIEPPKGVAPDIDAIMEHVRSQLPKLSWPDAIEVVDEMPLGATGKVQKTKLREKFKDYVLPDLREGGDSASDGDGTSSKGFNPLSFLRRK